MMNVYLLKIRFSLKKKSEFYFFFSDLKTTEEKTGSEQLITQQLSIRECTGGISKKPPTKSILVGLLTFISFIFTIYIHFIFLQ